jgi:hypothetical protein
MPVSPEQLKSMFGGEIVKNSDTEIDFDKPIKGKYLGEVVSLGLKEVKTQDSRTVSVVDLKMKITEDLEGSEPSFNRYASKSYWLEDGEFSTIAQTIQRLANDLYTMGVFDEINLDATSITKDNINLLTDIDIKGRKVKLSLYKSKGGKQAVKVVVLEEAATNWDK